MENLTSEKKDLAPEMISSEPPTPKATPTQFEATITSFASGKDNEDSTSVDNGAEKRAISKETASNMMFPTTPETTITPLKSEHSTSEQGYSTKTSSEERAKTMKSSSTSEATMTSLITEQPCNEQGNHTKEPAKTTSKAPVTSQIPVLTVMLTVGLATLSLIAVVVLIILCRKRRKEKTTVPDETLKQTTTEDEVPRNAEGHQTNYENEKETLNQLEENGQGHIYPEYVTLKENNAFFSAGTGNLYHTANFNIGDGTYSVTLSVNNLKQAVQANSYDHVRLKKTNDGHYDHVDLHDQRNIGHDIDTYDQTNALAADNAYYDTFQENVKLHQQFEENEYDAANFHKTN